MENNDEIYYVFGATESLFTMLSEKLPHRTANELINAVEAYCITCREQMNVPKDDTEEGWESFDDADIPWDQPLDYVH